MHVILIYVGGATAIKYFMSFHNLNAPSGVIPDAMWIPARALSVDQLERCISNRRLSRHWRTSALN